MKSFSFGLCIAWIRKSHQPTHQHLVLAYTLETFLLSFISASQRNHTLHFTILEKCFCFSSAFFHAEMIDVLCRLHSLIDEEELLVLDTCSTSFTNGLIFMLRFQQFIYRTISRYISLLPGFFGPIDIMLDGHLDIDFWCWFWCWC